MFEITKNHLLHLNDVDLRELVARLCEAELQLAGAPVSAVRWAGAQTAADGGLDVDCRIERDGFRGDFVPRPRTGFQVKKPKMPPAKIANEMSPDGQLRPIFAQLAASNGCYIIVSLDDDPTGRTATRRHNAMRGQLDEVRALGDIRTEFYGRSELANWLRQHPGVQLWTRNVLGIPLDGWKPFGRWTNTPPRDSDELVCKPGLQLLLPGKNAAKLEIEAGIQEIRTLVRTSDKALRIVGLSGVGKSRLVQALFEDSVGHDALDRSQAIYTDLGTNPTPSPREMLARLAANGHRAIVVLDNCPVETHNLLAIEVSTTPNLRLITIEYDIREDKPEVTTVIRINAEGTKIVEALVSRRFPELGRVNSQRIAQFSGGNARLGMALANAVADEENLSGFSDVQLFDRLFLQRGPHDADLLAAAQALALVYSFSIRVDEDGVNELAILASLVGQDRLALFRAAQSLAERQLVQQRGHWRAVLPPAVSNRLAAAALNNIPPEDLPDRFENLANARLLKSFGKRLGYLHDHARSQQIVRSWLSPAGLIHAVEALDVDLIQLFTNVAPVAPEAALNAIEARARQPQTESFFGEANPNARAIAVLLCSIAYDAALFERCIALLVQFATSQGDDQRPRSDVPDRLFGLFALYLSGTEAGPELREKALRRALFSDRPNERDAGLGMLEIALKSGHWSSFAVFEFGARPRSFGYWPRTSEEEDRWFLRFISVARQAATSDQPDLSERARELLASEFRQLWHYPALRSALSATAAAVHTHKSWPEGWRAVRSIKHLDYRDAKEPDMPAGFDLLDQLDHCLWPDRLSDEVRTYVCDVGHQYFSLYDEFDDDDRPSHNEFHRRAAARAHDLGVTVGSDPDVLDELSQELFTGEFGFRIEFGQGLASESDDPSSLWHRLVGYLALSEGETRHCHILYGVLEAIHERNDSLARAILADSAANPTLRPFIVNLHLSVPVCQATIGTLLGALDFDDTPLDQFGSLAWQRPPRVPDEAMLCDVFRRLLAKPGGVGVVLAGLSMRIRGFKKDRLGFGPDLKEIGILASAAILRDAPHQHGGITDRHLAAVLDFCLDDTEFPEETAEVFDAFLARVAATYGTTGGLHGATAVLAEKVPARFLDGIFLNPTFQPTHRRELFSERHQRANSLERVGIPALMTWCHQGNFQERLAMLAQAVHPFANDADDEGIVFSDLAHAIIDSTRDPATVLASFANSIRPSGRSGSLANIIARRRRPFELLFGHEREDVRTSAAKLVPQIRDAEERERQRERAEDQERDQRFE